MPTLPNPVTYVEQHFGIALTHVSGCEYRSLNGCPRCGDGGKGTDSDRFRMFADASPLVWCRKCGYQEFVDELNDSGKRLTDVERRLLRVETEQRRAKREREETEKRLSALERMKVSTAHIEYHNSLDVDAVRYWHSQGITDESIRKYMLGFCESCPTAREHASYTIPYFASDGKTLLNIRHRLKGVTKGNRYFPHMAGLQRQLYLSQNVAGASELIVGEGEKKILNLVQNTFPAVGIQGCHGFDMRWLPHFSHLKKIWIALDPDAMEAADKLAQEMHDKGNLNTYVVHLPVKADDFFIKYNGSASQFNEYLRYARRVR